MIIINVPIRYTLPMRLWTANAVIIINVTIRYVLPTKLQRESAMIIINVTFRVCSTHKVTESKCGDYY